MKFLVLTALFGSASALKTVEFVGVDAPKTLEFVGTDLAYIANAVNAAQSTWTADPEAARFASIEEAASLCGTYLSDHPDYFKLPDAADVLDDFTVIAPENLPTDFDSRTQWSSCSVISKIRDQSACGSCWAFGSTEAFEDRQCVATGKDTEFSTEDTAACCSGFLCGMSQGCNGGQPSSALDWMTRAGVVTGGDFTDIGSGSTCKPYTLKPCAHHVPPTSKYPACPTDEYPTPRCERSCSESSYPTSYSDDKAKAGKAYSLNSVNAIMSDIVSKGPVSAAFTVYADFPTYKSGVYTHVSGQALGGHAVEIIGFGVESGTDYWLVKNSWNEQWGLNGTFKIKRGTNECGIEADISTVSF